MWFEAGDDNRAASAIWWATDSVLLQPWRLVTGALSGLRRRWLGGPVRMDRVSEEWLQQHGSHHYKHRGDSG